jgi:type I restriction enzyme S subunit
VSRIDDLVAELCPGGVAYEELGTIATLRRGTSITKGSTSEGGVPVIAGGRTPAYTHGEANRTGETIVVAGSGAYAGFVSFWSIPIYVSDAFTVAPQPDTMLPKYCFYVLKSRERSLHGMKTGGGVPHLYPRDVAPLRVPVPPLEVQREIVMALDAFTGLEAELQAELRARKTQLEYYRGFLLDSPEVTGAAWMPLGDIADVRVGQAPPPGLLEGDGGFPYVNAGTTASGLATAANTPAGAITIPSRGQGGVGVVGYQRTAFWCGPLCYRVTADVDHVTTRYLYFFLKSIQGSIRALQQTGGTPALNRKELVLVRVAVPSIDQQERIAAILDRLDALVNDEQVGLPAELTARRLQYEHYRDRLLTFPEPA